MEQLNIVADDYLLFVAIVEQESMVRAAEHLGMPKATVSRRLNNLEAALGQRLLLRTTRRLTLTEFGQAFLDHCRRVAEEVAAAQDFVRSQEERPRGRLRISMPVEYAKQRNIARAIASFTETYPEVLLDLDLSSRRVDLIGERFDLAIRMGRLESDSSLVARKIEEQIFSLYASPTYLSRHPAPKQPENLMQHTALRLLSARGTAIPWKLTNGKDTWEGVPPGKLTLGSIDFIQQLALEGAGIAALPNGYVEEDVRQKRLVRVLSKWSFPSIPAWAVTPTRRYLPTKTRAFLAHLEQYGIGKKM